MEDALEDRTRESLNIFYRAAKVLILVLMEDALEGARNSKNHCSRGSSKKVLILVLMEDALEGQFFAIC